MKLFGKALGKLPLLRFPIILSLFLIMLPVSYLSLAEIADGINNRLYFSARLEEASRLELEANTLFSKAELFARGNPRVAAKDVQLALDLLWSRVNVMGTKSYREVQVDEALDKLLIGELLDAMPRLEAGVNNLRPGISGSYHGVDLFAMQYRERIIAFSDAANKARRQRLNTAVETHLESVTNLKRIQIAYVVLGVVAVVYVLFELFLTRRLNLRLNASIEEKHRLLSTDHLTGIGNRASFENLLHQLKAMVGANFAVIYFDLDGFKQVNDTLGHGMGDMLLKHVAAILLAVRQSDNAFAFRFGGDEFAVVLTGNRETARHYAARAVQKIAAPTTLDANVVQVSASAGYSHLDDLRSLEPVDALMRNADLALYAAKSAGRNCVQAFNGELLIEYERRTFLEDVLSHAITKGLIDIAFQPVFDLPTRTLRAVKVVPRWFHNVYGTIPPADVTEIADGINQGAALLLVLLRTTFNLLGNLPTQTDLRVYVEAGENLFSQPGFAQSLFELLERHRIGAGQLQIELTGKRSGMFTEAFLASIRSLRDAGVVFATNDVGRAIDSRNRLANLDFGTLKLNRMLIEEATRSERSRGIIQGLSTMAVKMGAEVIAEGVDQREDVERLQRLGITLGQGEALAPAMTPDELLRYLAGRAGPSVVAFRR
ncbi:EAL domain-containing protein [Shinella sp.]|uniref:EAL domain-containing protein n=1 Tax=Shinella sp. TaxID=1870904 RepID=UPI0028ACCBEC|nr:EAL domain-containing protein [Shinella sp.]